MGHVGLDRLIETGMPFFTGTKPLVRASAFSTIRVWLPSTSLVDQLNNANAVSASTPLVVAPALQLAGIADQICTSKQSARPSHAVATVGDLTDRILGPANSDQKNPDQ